ncbi:MAG: dioxygenase [Proteobacteria bacterium]|uniref:DODA-type extradiol aromatic ring-opening family dioxygenase n=1 Tax=Aquabacterium sp. TaxID=1872578 RepID=UPI0035C77F6E|nr:dioxygenase [Pseudomonadota bacterium]
MTSPAPTLLPTLFLSHGSPMIAIDPREAGLYMQGLAARIDALFGRPRAILAMSPHTATRAPFALGAERHQAIHDFGGFPAALYELRYDAAGDPALARDVVGLLQQAGIAAQWTEQGGLDHGIWTPLLHIYPQGDVPVVPLSLTPQATPAQVFAQGRALRSLRAQGVLVIGSGSLTHNLRRFFTRPTEVDAPEEPDCAAFRTWVHQQSEGAHWPELLNYRRLAPHAEAMHPTDEHWLPFYFAAGAACEAEQPWPAQAVRLHGSVTHGHLAMDAYGFGAGVQALADVPLR